MFQRLLELLNTLIKWISKAAMGANQARATQRSLSDEEGEFLMRK